jgi:hypothetical protein
MDRFYVDMAWETRVKYSEWRMVKERAMANMNAVATHNGPRVHIDELETRVCTRDDRFRTGVFWASVRLQSLESGTKMSD